MEYAFSVAGLGASGEVLLTAPEYTEGRLERYHFEHGSGTLGVDRSADGTPRLPRSGPARFRRHAQSPLLDLRGSRSVQFDRSTCSRNPDVEPSPATLMVLDFALELQRRLVPDADCARCVVASSRRRRSP